MRLLPCIPRLTTLAYMRTARFSTTPFLLSGSGKALPPRTPLLDADLIENFLKGSGPGGQKINKTSSAVQLKHIPTGIVVKYQDTRSREINRKMARRILQDRIEEMELGDEARTKVRAREKAKKKASSSKKSRRKYRALEGKDGQEGGGDGEAGEAKDGFERGDEPQGMVEVANKSSTVGG
jgi:protein subunit release factor B